jgi:hypothetical protein
MGQSCPTMESKRSEDSSKLPQYQNVAIWVTLSQMKYPQSITIDALSEVLWITDHNGLHRVPIVDGMSLSLRQILFINDMETRNIEIDKRLERILRSVPQLDAFPPGLLAMCGSYHDAGMIITSFVLHHTHSFVPTNRYSIFIYECTKLSICNISSNIS